MRNTARQHSSSTSCQTAGCPDSARYTFPPGGAPGKERYSASGDPTRRS